MGLEDYLYGSKTIRDFLRHFSEQQWQRLTKATFMLGIQYLANVADVRKLAVKDIEDIVIELSVKQIAGGCSGEEAQAILRQLKKQAKQEKKKGKRSRR